MRRAIVTEKRKPGLDPELVANLGEGIKAHVYQAMSYNEQPGRWHAHISVIEPRLLKDLPRYLGSTCSGTTVFGKGTWASLSADTEQEAHDRAAAVIGWIMGARLAVKFRPREVPATVVRDWRLT